MRFWRLVQKDAKRELRNREGLQAGLVLVGLFFLLFLFTGGTLGDRMAAIALWSPLVYAAAAVTGRGLASEADRGTLEWLLTGPVPRAWHGWSRTLVDGVTMCILGAAALLLLRIGFAVHINATLVLVTALAVLGLTITGALAGGLAAQARGRDILVPILLIPVAAPLLQSGITASLDALAGTPERLPLLLMAGYDLIAFGVAWLLWPFVLEAD